jgi:KaiC/GvpD/RAD55 family RecA-like ATPase
MKVNVKKLLGKSKSILLLLPSLKYNEKILDIAKQLSGETLCYITLNKTKNSLIELFKEKKINTKKIVFVDAITKTIKNDPKDEKGVIYVSNPAALTEISLAVTKFLDKKFKYIIFDSITNLLVYQQKAPINKFLSNLNAKISSSSTKIIFYALSIKEQEKIIQECCLFVDKVETLDK